MTSSFVKTYINIINKRSNCAYCAATTAEAAACLAVRKKMAPECRKCGEINEQTGSRVELLHKKSHVHQYHEFLCGRANVKNIIDGGDEARQRQ